MKARFGILLGHVGEYAMNHFEARAAALVLDTVEELRLAGRLASEARGSHAVTAKERLDPRDQLGFGGDVHGRLNNSAFADIASENFQHLSAIASIAVEKSLCENADMAAASDLFERLMAVKPDGLSQNAWALRAGVNRTIFNDVRKRGNIRHDSLVKLLGAAGVSLAQFEAGEVLVRSEVRGTGMSPAEALNAWALAGNVPPVPLVGSAFGGEWNDLEDVEMIELRMAEVLDYLARPPSLAEDPEAYAVEIVGDSMAPRFEPGERAFVSPKAAVRPGDDVIVQLRAEGDPEESDIAGQIVEVLIKRLVRRTARFVELRQFNPDRTFQVPIERVRRIHRVRGRL